VATGRLVVAVPSAITAGALDIDGPLTVLGPPVVPTRSETPGSVDGDTAASGAAAG
jgi:hypothetical protein